MLGRTKLIAGVLAVATGVAGGYAWLAGTEDYEVTLVMPSAAQLAVGSPVWIDGAKAGQVSDLDVRDGKAIVTAAVAEEHAPLHAGTTSRVEWKSALGERMLTLYRGSAKNPAIPDGGMIEGHSRQIEVDQVLAALDKPTREHLRSLIKQLNGTFGQGSENDLRRSLNEAGPALRALGSVLAAVGKDGPAIKALVKRLDRMTGALAARRADVSGTVRNLTSATGSLASRESALSEALAEMPATLRTARGTLDKLPKTSEATVPLLQDLRSPTGRLKSVARNLSPVLRDLTPALADLTPTLAAAERLLGSTPALLDTGRRVLPGATSAFREYQPAVAFMRPYTPELVGWFANWGMNFAPYDSQGHVWSATLAPGSNGNNESLVRPPGASTSSSPYPGEVVGQPWTDAHGSGMR
ncbi:MAG: MlaD family protein [Haloechinothrix sp.]